MRDTLYIAKYFKFFAKNSFPKTGDFWRDFNARNSSLAIRESVSHAVEGELREQTDGNVKWLRRPGGPRPAEIKSVPEAGRTARGGPPRWSWGIRGIVSIFAVLTRRHTRVRDDRGQGSGGRKREREREKKNQGNFRKETREIDSHRLPLENFTTFCPARAEKSRPIFHLRSPGSGRGCKGWRKQRRDSGGEIEKPKWLALKLPRGNIAIRGTFIDPPPPSLEER